MIDQFISPPQVGPTAASMGRIPTRQTDSRRSWQSIAQLARASMGLRTGINFAYGQMAAMKQGGFLVLDRPHPFKIYNVPTVCVAVPDSATDWLRYRVRAGQVGIINVDGTDDVDDPDSDEVPTDGTGDIVIASAATTFFWIELTSPGGTSTATIKYGATPTTNGWSAFPDTDGRFLLIGSVDTTDTVNKQGKVRQLIRTDILKGIGTTDCDGTGTPRDVEYDGYSFIAPA